MNLMKMLTLVAMIGFSQWASAQSGTGVSDIGSAFVNGDTLYVTVLGDCNNIAGQLSVDSICQEGRLTRNWAIQCSAKLEMNQTVMGCPGLKKPKPHVLELSLSKSKVASEARLLKLEINGQVLDVKIK